MKTRHWIAAAVLATTVQATALAQQPTSPVAPRAGAATAPVDGKVAVIRSGEFYERILELKVKQDQVRGKYQPRITELEKLGNQIETMANDIKSKEKVVPADKLQQMAEELNRLQTNYKRQGEDLQAEIQREGEAAIKPVRAKILDFAKAYSAQRNIVLILDKAGIQQSGTVAWVAEAIDITDDFVSEYNKANPVPGAAAPARPGAGK